jgi:hypothetical protein
VEEAQASRALDVGLEVLDRRAQGRRGVVVVAAIEAHGHHRPVAGEQAEHQDAAHEDRRS